MVKAMNFTDPVFRVMFELSIAMIPTETMACVWVSPFMFARKSNVLAFIVVDAGPNLEVYAFGSAFCISSARGRLFVSAIRL